ncbi:MAG: hypothetical protein OQK82_03185 [Candidatus Pacearchaeota archaeon]|nr:hypothetical protein [Candidatus Pacearchaeota archaeon]
MKLWTTPITTKPGTARKPVSATFKSSYLHQCYTVTLHHPSGKKQELTIPLHELRDLIDHANEVMRNNDAHLALNQRQQNLMLDDTMAINLRYQT